MKKIRKYEIHKFDIAPDPKFYFLKSEKLLSSFLKSQVMFLLF